MIPISPYDLETGHTYYMEYYDTGVFTYEAETGLTYYSEGNKGVRTHKYRGVINNLKAGTCYGHNVLEIVDMIEIGNTIEIADMIENVNGHDVREIADMIENVNGHDVREIADMIEYVNGQETTSTEPDSPTFPGNVCYISVNTNATDPQYWLFYKPVADYLMTTQVLKQRTRLDNVTIQGLYKQHFGCI